MPAASPYQQSSSAALDTPAFARNSSNPYDSNVGTLDSKPAHLQSQTHNHSTRNSTTFEHSNKEGLVHRDAAGGEGEG